VIVILRNDDIDVCQFSFVLIMFVDIDVISASWRVCYIGLLFDDGFVWVAAYEFVNYLMA
jgi:hypothetical protein